MAHIPMADGRISGLPVTIEPDMCMCRRVRVHAMDACAGVAVAFSVCLGVDAGAGAGVCVCVFVCDCRAVFGDRRWALSAVPFRAVLTFTGCSAAVCCVRYVHLCVHVACYYIAIDSVRPCMVLSLHFKCT